jgi:hypothetical protein
MQADVVAFCAERLDQADCLPREIGPRQDRPFPVLHRLLRFTDTPPDAQHQADRQIRHRSLVAAGCNGDDAAEIPRRLQVDTVVADAAARDDFQIGKRRQQVAGDVGMADDPAIRVRH